MRLLVALLLAVAPVAAEDLLPREGSGWAGFKAGSWVRMKRSVLQPGRVISPTVTKIKLVKADDKSLTLATEAENALGMANESKQVVPAKGDAGADEKETVEQLGNEVVLVAGKRLECARVRSTVTGPAGKRVITKWIASEPKVWAKRTETFFDADGKQVSRATLLLASLGEERTVGTRTIKCLKYKTLRSDAGMEWTGEAFLSREIPGGLVWTEEEARRAGTLVVTMRIEALEFEAK